jgi:hypothetical protein
VTAGVASLFHSVWLEHGDNARVPPRQENLDVEVAEACPDHR